jgi:hypothetical protein
MSLIKSIPGNVLGERGPGRIRISCRKNLRTWFSKTTLELLMN